jgi:hypothetical protein
MNAKTMVVALMAIVTGSCVRADTSELVPRSRARIYSTLGFSFLPPPGNNWTEEFGKNQIAYSKETDPRFVTFYAGALEINLHAPLPDKEALTAFVKAKKDEWGTDGRFANVSSSFLAEPQQESCVRYRMAANDRVANNRGTHEFLLLQIVGRFCTHPQNSDVAVDIFYSARHIPGYDAKDLRAEGEEFLNSLAFYTPPDESKGDSK